MMLAQIRFECLRFHFVLFFILAVRITEPVFIPDKCGQTDAIDDSIAFADLSA